LLASGKKVVLQGSVSGIGMEPYYLDVVVARIWGAEKPEEELIFSAHLDHPKEAANDNASGSASILDIARTMKQLIANGKLPQPRRSIRFLWVPEWNGTMAYIDGHPEFEGPALGGSWLANVNMDMVGENLELLHSSLGITRSPASIPSCLNDVVENMAAMVDRMNIRTPRGSQSVFNYKMYPYGGGSDHMMFIDRKIPGTMLCHGDYTHHSSEDTPDKVDPVELERCEIIGAGTVWYLANLNNNEATDLLYLVQKNAMNNLGAAIRKTMQYLAANDTVVGAGDEAKNMLGASLATQIDGLVDVLHFNNAPETKQLVTSIQAGLKYQYEALAKEVNDALKGTDAAKSVRSIPDKRVPVRMTRGPLDFGLPASKLSAEQAAWYSSPEYTLDGNMRFELVNFIDGKHTVSEIRDAISAEYRPVKLSVVAHYVEDLVSLGLAKWK